MNEGATLSELMCTALQAQLMRHKEAEQQQVEALLASQKHLTSNVRTLINALDTILALSTPKYNSSQGDLVHSLASSSRGLAHKLETISDRLQRIEAHLTATEAAAAAPRQQQPS